MLSKEVRNIANHIGEFYLAKNNGDIDKTNDELERLRLNRIELSSEAIVLVTSRPGILIGKRGENITKLIEYLAGPYPEKKVKIVEDMDDLLYLLHRMPEDEWDYPDPSVDYDSIPDIGGEEP